MKINKQRKEPQEDTLWDTEAKPEFSAGVTEACADHFTSVSTNEELTTVNEELSHRNAELARLINDLTNLQNSVQTAIVLLSRDLVIRRFNPLAETRFNLSPQDVGRSIANVRLNFDLADLKTWISGCIKAAAPREKEVRDAEGVWYSLRTLPYRTDNGEIDGAVLVLIDINALKQNEQELSAAHEYAQAIVEQVAPLVVLDADLRVIMANDSFFDHFKASANETVDHHIFDLGNGQWDIPALREALNTTLPERGVVEAFEVEHEFEAIGLRNLVLQASRLNLAHSIILRIDDVTAERKATRLLEELNQTLEARVDERTAEIQARVEQLQRISLKLANAEDKERRRLAVLLHDDIQQMLVAVKMHVAVGSEPEERQKKDAFVQEMLDQAIDATRTLARQLAPRALSEGDLEAGFQWLANWARERYALNVQIEAQGGAEPEDPEMRIFLFEVVRELLLNVVKHAGTDRVMITLTRDDELVRLQIKDFGRGFHWIPANGQTKESGSGLTSLKERLALVGGFVEVDSAPGKGTCVDLVFPLQAAPPASDRI